MIRAVATDIDGTFLRQDRTYDRPLFREIFRAMTEQGARFIIASGDQYFFLRSLFPDDADKLAYVADNGVLVVDHNQEIATDHIDFDQALAIDHYLSTVPDICYCASGRQCCYLPQDAPDWYLDRISQYYTKYRKVNHLSDVKDDYIMKFIVNVPHSQIKRLDAEFKQKFPGVVRPTVSGNHSIDLIIPNEDKGAGLKKLLAHWQMDPADLIVFGDGENDLEMFDFAGTSYAMANAEKPIQQAADHVIGTNDDQAVLHELAKLFGVTN